MKNFADKLDQDLEQMRPQCQSRDTSNKPAVQLEIQTTSGNMGKENANDSLLSLMTDFAEQLDKDSNKLTVQNDQLPVDCESNASLSSFLHKVADKMDRESQQEGQLLVRESQGKIKHYSSFIIDLSSSIGVVIICVNKNLLLKNVPNDLLKLVLPM